VFASREPRVGACPDQKKKGALIGGETPRLKERSGKKNRNRGTRLSCKRGADFSTVKGKGSPPATGEGRGKRKRGRETSRIKKGGGVPVIRKALPWGKKREWGGESAMSKEKGRGPAASPEGGGKILGDVWGVNLIAIWGGSISWGGADREEEKGRVAASSFKSALQKKDGSNTHLKRHGGVTPVGN